MKEIQCLFFFIFCSLMSFSQTLCEHNGKPLKGNVLVVQEHQSYDIRVLRVQAHQNYDFEVRVKQSHQIISECGDWHFVEHHQLYVLRVLFVEPHQTYDLRIYIKE